MTLLLMCLSGPLLAEPLPPLPTVQGSAAWPSLAVDGDTLLITWLEPVPPRRRRGERTWAVRFASLDGGWSTPVTLAEGPTVMGNWADYPSVVAGGDGALYAHWLQKIKGGPYAYGVQVTRSLDQGATWTPLGWLHDDTSPTEHGFVSLVPVPDGVEAYWLDGRAMADGGPMALRTATVGDDIGPSTVVDDRTCDCCATGAGLGPDGSVVAWRDRTDDEVRDISLVVGGHPRTGSTDGWSIAGCPVNGPSVDGSPDGVIVGWYTAAAETPRALAAFVGPDGLEPAVLIDGTSPVGRVDVVLVSDQEAVITWLDKEEDQGVIRARRVGRDGRLGQVVDIGRTVPGRASGFPKVVQLGSDLVWAWTVPGPENALDLATHRTPLNSLPALEALSETAEAQAPTAPATRPALTGTTLDGESFSLDDLAGRPVLVNLWATWCGPCVAELPQLATLATEHPELAVIGVSIDMDDRRAAVEQMVQRFGLPYPIVHGGGEAWAQGLGVSNVPVTWLFAPSGELLWHVAEGFDPAQAEFQEALATALRSPQSR